MVALPGCSRYVSRFVVLTGCFRCLGPLAFRVGAVKMTPDAEVYGKADGYDCCGAQYQDDKQDLDHHRHSGYQIESGCL